MKLGLGFGLLALAATAFGDSIVVNGDFGTGDLTGWSESGWGYTTGFGSPTTTFATEGCTGFCSLSQLLDTNAGDTYTLSFSYNPDILDSPPQGPAELQVQWNGGTIVIDLVCCSTPVAGQTASLEGFNTYTVTDLVASTPSTELNFRGIQFPASDGLTGISVTDTSAVPELGSYLMAALGFLALGAEKLRARAKRLLLLQ